MLAASKEVEAMRAEEERLLRLRRRESDTSEIVAYLCLGVGALLVVGLLALAQRLVRREMLRRAGWLEEREFLIVPRGVEHRPIADEAAHVLLFELASTLNTGNVQNERTVAHLGGI
jgi:hypothetical protein